MGREGERWRENKWRGGRKNGDFEEILRAPGEEF